MHTNFLIDCNRAFVDFDFPIMKNIIIVVAIILAVLFSYKYHNDSVKRERAAVELRLKQDREKKDKEAAERKAKEEADAKAAAAANNTSDSSSAGTISFSGDWKSDLLKVSAIIDNIKTTGQECESALKVDSPKVQVCQPFIGQLVEGGEWGQASNKLRELMQDQMQGQQNIAEISKIRINMEEVVRHKEFMMANLRSRQ